MSLSQELTGMAQYNALTQVTHVASSVSCHATTVLYTHSARPELTSYRAVRAVNAMPFHSRVATKC